MRINHNAAVMPLLSSSQLDHDGFLWQSEAEPRSMRRSDQRRRDHGSDKEAGVHSSKESVQRNGHSKHSYRQPIGGLRRSMSQLDLMSEPSTPVYYVSSTYILS